jgi:probable HAF family extracellular repeat protein
MKDLGTLGGTDSLAEGINASGQITGFSYTDKSPNATTGEPTMHPFLWDGSAMHDLGSLGGTMAAAVGINDDGRVIGWSNLAGDTAYHPFLWDAHGMIDLKTLGGDNGEAIWINNAGQIVGYAELPGNATHHAFLWEKGGMTDLGAVSGDTCSIAYGLNSRGQVVGDSGTSALPGQLCGGTGHGFLWENGGPAVDPSSLYPPLTNGLVLLGLCCINDLGEMAGFGALPNGDTREMLIVPCDEHHPNVGGCDYSLAAIPGDAESKATPPAPVVVRDETSAGHIAAIHTPY